MSQWKNNFKLFSGVIKDIFSLNPEEQIQLVDQLRKIIKRRNPRIPDTSADFYQMEGKLNPGERQILLKVRKFMEEEVSPIADYYWERGEFPYQIIEKFKALNIGGITLETQYGGQGKSHLLEGMIAQEMARVDVSTCTFFGAHDGLAIKSIYLCGSEEQKQKFIPPMIRMEKIGAFGLTEPEVGSAVALGLKTTCQKAGDEWIINGQKKWIGNATFADYIIIWAKDVDSHEVKGFIVDRLTPGLTTERIEGKQSLRTVQNALITLNQVTVPEDRRLQKANTFKDTAVVLKYTRAGVAWQAVGCARGAYENTLNYTLHREQFGRTIAAFQITQDLLAQMLSQITAMQSMMFRLSELLEEGTMSDEQASLAKVFCTVSCRDITSKARELMGGNGILIENKVARFLADSEALYSYEGTKQINSLIVGRKITGISSFT